MTKFIGKRWQDGKGLADKAAVELAATLAERIDKRRATYLVAHSLGCRVALLALERLAGEQRIDGAFFMGAAVDHRHDCTAATSRLSYPLFNYHSQADNILKTGYQAAEGVPAAGRDGFRQGFEPDGLGNVRNVIFRGGHFAYEPVAKGIAEVVRFLVSEQRPSRNREPKPGGRRMEGKVWWDNIASAGVLLLQRNKVSGYYRVVDRSGGNRRVDWAETADDVLHHLFGPPLP